nr:DUF2975 domain-containing protein [Anaeromonas frigoriresistens]
MFLIGISVLTLCIFGLPWISRDAEESSWKMAYNLYGFLIAMYVSTISFFVALYQAFKLLSYIDTNKAIAVI